MSMDKNPFHFKIAPYRSRKICVCTICSDLGVPLFILATICTGRSAAQYTSQGTGTGLWIQNGTDPVTNSQKIPAKQADIDKTMWTKGVCFVSMGM